MSGLEGNKVIAAVLFAGVAAWTASLVAEVFGHHEELAENAYPIAVAAVATGGSEAPAAAGPEPVLALLASADPAAGEKLVKKCSSCHTFDDGGPDKIGPNLWGVVGRNIASGGFAYSDALQGMSGESWSYESLNLFLAKPKDYAPGTKMTFAGLKKVQDRANVIAYLRGQSSAPMPMPSAEEMEAATSESPAEPEWPEAPAEAEAPSESPDEPESPDATEVQQAAAPTDLGALIAAASAEDGKKVYRKCKACHTPDKGGANKIGPNLWGVLGRNMGSHEGFKFSKAMAAMTGDTWSYEKVDTFVTNPKQFVPGTKMAFPGLKKAADRAALLAYLRELNDNPPPLPE